MYIHQSQSPNLSLSPASPHLIVIGLLSTSVYIFNFNFHLFIVDFLKAIDFCMLTLFLVTCYDLFLFPGTFHQLLEIFHPYNHIWSEQIFKYLSSQSVYHLFPFITMNGCWILTKAFSASIDMIMWFLSLLAYLYDRLHYVLNI